LGALTTVANTTLALNADSLTTTGAVTVDADITTLNLGATGTASTMNSLSAAGVKTMNVSGDAKVTLTSHTLTALETVTVTNTGGAAMSGTVLGNTVLFTGGAGADAISVGATTKANTMGDGNDTVIYGGAAGTGGSVNAGGGTDIVSMTFTEANAADGSAVFNTAFTNFETLNLEDTLSGALDIDGLNNATTAVLVLGSNGGTLNNIDSGSTVHIKANNAGTLAVNVDGSLATSTDSITLKLDKAGILTGNTVTIANTETINIDGSDTAAAGAAAAINTMTLTAAAATSIVVTGNNGLNLTATGSTAVTDFDASAVVGNSTTASANVAATTDTAANLAVTYTSLNATANAAVSIKGGAGNDTLTGSAGAVNVDTISGGAGDDTIAGGSGADVLDGGANSATGVDTFTVAEVTGATGHGLANLAGMAINLSAADVLQSTIAAAAGGTIVLGGGAGTAGAALAAGTVGYLSTTAANSTATMVRDSITGFEAVVGSALADYIAGSAAADTINGADGADDIVAGAGNDTITIAGTGQHDAGETIDGGTGTDTINVTADLIAITADASIKNVENITLNGTAVDLTLTGSTEAFTITGDTGANIIVDGTGASTITTGTGADQVTGAAGDDTINFTAAAGDADVAHFSAFGTNGSDTITGFVTTEDHLNFDNAVMTGCSNLVAITGLAAGAGDADFIDNEAYVYADGATAHASGTAGDVITTYTDLAQVGAFLSDHFTASHATANDTVAGDEGIFVINDLVANLSYAYHFKEADGNVDASAVDVIASTELTLLATITEIAGAALVAADIT